MLYNARVKISEYSISNSLQTFNCFIHDFKNRTRLTVWPVRPSTDQGSGSIRSIRPKIGWIEIRPAEPAVRPVNRTNQLVHFESSGSIQIIFFFSIKTTSFLCFWHQNDVILEDIKPPFPKPPSPNCSCRSPLNLPLTHCNRLPQSAVSPCKISFHWSLQDHHRLSRLFPAVLLQDGKPPHTVGTLAVSPLRTVVIPLSLYYKPPLWVRPVVASLKPGNQGMIFNYLLFNVLILEIYFLGLIINIQFLPITLLNLKTKFQEFTWVICESNIYNI